MATSQTQVSMSRLLSVERPPRIPQNLDPEMQKFFTSLLDYIRRLMAMFSPQNMTSLLPPIPDPTKDYVLAYDGTTKEVLWIETTDVCP